MSKVSIINRFIVALVITNLGLVGYIFFNKPNGLKHHEGPRDIIIERLKFDKDQIAKYDILISAHRKAIRKNDQKIITLKDLLYLNLANDMHSGINDSLAMEIGKWQTQVEYINYKHFEDIKKLCHTNQVNYYNELIKDIAHLFFKPKGHHRLQ